jgi:hypothetical protein
VTKVHVRAGTAVEKGAALVTLGTHIEGESS